MSKQSETKSPYEKRPLYIYDLPPELIDTLALQPTGLFSQTREETEAPTEQSSRALNENGVSTSTICTLCKAQFRDVNDQRQHVKSDFHRYNLKLQVKGIRPLDEARFMKSIGDLDESISGSESSDSDDDNPTSSTETTLAALLRKQAKVSKSEAEVDSIKTKGPGNAPIYWLKSPKLPEGKALGIYRAVFTNQEQEAAQTNLVNILKQKQLQPLQVKQHNDKQLPVAASSDPHFFLCMIGGGHFAAAIIALSPEIRKGHGGLEERHAVLKAHKTFHRYTTRRKQGGSQSANDNAKGKAHSVGSSIRRANEAALVTDIRNLLSEWRTMIDTAQLVFTRATGSQNRHTLFGPYDDQVLSSKDSRLRSFPFSTRRATQNELIRAFQELTRAKIQELVVETLNAPNEKQAQQVRQSKPESSTPQLTAEEQELVVHTTQLQNLIRRSKAPGVLLYLKKNNLSGNFSFYPPGQGINYHAPTLLHFAASQNSAAVVVSLITKASADPTICNEDGKTPFDIAGDSKTHDAFRMARHELGENAFDWSAAHVPAALSAEESEAKLRKEQQVADAAESERRRLELQKISQAEEAQHVGRYEKTAGVGMPLSNLTEKTWVEKNEQSLRGLTPEMRQRLERERRARAAEARFKTSSTSK